ncbi:MAG: hypothetical protein DRO52_00435 [Candidatus Hecatellales archaeon]|nr:MAG: hypothetical protein DRO52_00435 [Candidatus Hecatellales archaeon]
MLRLEHVSRRWSEFSVEDACLDCSRGEYFVVMGPTGAGKTLLLQLIAGIYYPESGKIFINGRDVTFHPPEKRNVGYVPQNYALFPHLNVHDNIAYGLKFKGYSKPEIEKTVREIAEHLEIGSLLQRNVETLSGGEQQRVALARALAVNPLILLLDEPLSALDSKTRENLRGYLRRINRVFRVTVVHVTHDLVEAVSLADRMAVMSRGRILQVDRPEQILTRPSSPFIAEFTGSINVFRGYATPRENMTEIRVSSLSLWAAGSRRGEVTAVVRPESILLAKQHPQTSARNVFRGTVVGVEPRGAVYAVTIATNSGLTFTSYITRSALLELELRRGDQVYLFFKASEVHML